MGIGGACRDACRRSRGSTWQLGPSPNWGRAIRGEYLGVPVPSEQQYMPLPPQFAHFCLSSTRLPPVPPPEVLSPGHASCDTNATPPTRGARAQAFQDGGAKPPKQKGTRTPGARGKQKGTRTPRRDVPRGTRPMLRCTIWRGEGRMRRTPCSGPHLRGHPTPHVQTQAARYSPPPLLLRRGVCGWGPEQPRCRSTCPVTRELSTPPRVARVLHLPLLVTTSNACSTCPISLAPAD